MKAEIWHSAAVLLGPRLLLLRTAPRASFPHRERSRPSRSTSPPRSAGQLEELGRGRRERGQARATGWPSIDHATARHPAPPGRGRGGPRRGPARPPSQRRPQRGHPAGRGGPETGRCQPQGRRRRRPEDARAGRERQRDPQTEGRRRGPPDRGPSPASAAAGGAQEAQQLARPEEIRAAEARLAQAQASVDLLKKTISDCTITSPVGGIVTHRPVEAGELVSPGRDRGDRLRARQRPCHDLRHGEGARPRRLGPGGRGHDRLRSRTDLHGQGDLHLARGRVHAEERPDQGGPGQARLRRQDRDREPGRPPQAGAAGRRRHQGRSATAR